MHGGLGFLLQPSYLVDWGASSSVFPLSLVTPPGALPFAMMQQVMGAQLNWLSSLRS